MKHAPFWIGIASPDCMAGGALADDNVMKELAPTGKLRVGIAVGPNPGAGNVAIDARPARRGGSPPTSARSLRRSCACRSSSCRIPIPGR